MNRSVVGRVRVGTAFPHLFHVLLQNELEAVWEPLWEYVCTGKPQQGRSHEPL